MADITPEMKQWLADNRDTYTFYLLHAMLHDPLMRSTLMNIPVTAGDFEREDQALVFGAVVGAVKVMTAINKQVPTPPSSEFLKTYLTVAARNESSDDETVAAATQLICSLQDPSFTEMHYCIRPYLEAWYGGIRAKKAARRIQRDAVPDVQGQISEMQRALSSANRAMTSGEDDPMDAFLTGQAVDRVMRRPTGVSGLDECLNGGWGRHECYLIFGGTGAGKSVAAGQAAWWEAKNNDGWPLIVTTELPAREYATRIVSNAASIPINFIGDCENAVQLRQAVASNPSTSYRLAQADEVLATFASRIRVQKVEPEDGMNLKLLLEREVMKFEQKMHKLPTWVCLDWLGSVADVGGAGKGNTSERAMAWEMAANGGVRFADESGIPTVLLAQAVNDSQLKRVLTIGDIGIAKGIGKNMTAVIGITNALDKAGIIAATRGQGDMPKGMILENQFFCVAKARKGEGTNIPVRREFRYQRFSAVVKV